MGWNDMIQVKSLDVLVSLLEHKFDPTLIALIKWVAWIADIYITEGHRPQRHSNDLHGLDPVRAIDGRASIYTQPQSLVDCINAKWVYDPTRPRYKCAVYGDEAHLDHIHFQVHPKTVFLKDGKTEPD